MFGSQFAIADADDNLPLNKTIPDIEFIINEQKDITESTKKYLMT